MKHAYFNLRPYLYLFYFRTNISIVVFGVIGTQIGEFCIQRNKCKKSTVRRVGGGFLAMTGFYFLLLGLLPCNVIDHAIIGLLIFSSFRSGTFVSLLPSFHDISPTYQDTLFSVRYFLNVNNLHI